MVVGAARGGPGAPPRLAGLDAYLDDARLYEPFRLYFRPSDGRPSVPMEAYIRMMAYEVPLLAGLRSPLRGMSDSISWWLFCRIAGSVRRSRTPRCWRRSPPAAAKQPSTS